MYILTHKTYLEEKVHKIIVFMENGDRFIQLDSTFTLSCFKCATSWKYVISSNLFQMMLFCQYFMFVVLIWQKKNLSIYPSSFFLIHPLASFFTSFSLSQLTNFSLTCSCVHCFFELPFSMFLFSHF